MREPSCVVDKSTAPLGSFCVLGVCPSVSALEEETESSEEGWTNWRESVGDDVAGEDDDVDEEGRNKLREED